MPTLLQTVSESILGPGGLVLDDLEPLVSELSVGDIDFADLFFERAEAETYSLEDGEVKDASYHRDAGVGVRACAGDKQGFAYSSEITAARIREARDVAIAIQDGRNPRGGVNLDQVSTPKLYVAKNPIPEKNATDKIAFLLDVDAKVQGGGSFGQAGAIRLAISKALLVENPELRADLKKAGYLTRDSRVKERKKVGLKKARKSPQFSKR